MLIFPDHETQRHKADEHALKHGHEALVAPVEVREAHEINDDQGHIESSESYPSEDEDVLEEGPRLVHFGVGDLGTENTAENQTVEGHGNEDREEQEAVGSIFVFSGPSFELFVFTSCLFDESYDEYGVYYDAR